MDLSIITTTDFKALFVRDFFYLNTWDVATTYNQGDQVYYSGLFYQCLDDGTITTIPSDDSPWQKITDDIYSYVLDADITRAFAEATMSFNQALFGTDQEITLAYLYLTAHYMVHDIRTATQGVKSVGEQTVASRSVGSVSESYDIPQAYKDSPILNFYTKTGYGMKYLSLVMPKLVGNVVAIAGATQA